MVALRRRIGSAFFVAWGQYGEVTHFAQEKGVSRQRVYREAKQVAVILEGSHTRQQIDRLQAENTALRNEVAHLQRQLAVAVVLDEDKQAEFATVGQGGGVTLPQCHMLLDVLIPGQAFTVPTLSRRTQAAGEKSGALLEVFDEYARQQVRDGAADEIYV